MINMKLTTVYKAHPRWAYQARALLRKKGLHPKLLDHPNIIAFQKAHGTYEVRIAVPFEEKEAAQLALQEWIQESTPKVANLQSKIFMHLFLSIIPPALFIITVRLVKGFIPEWSMITAFFLWFALAILLGFLQRSDR